MATIVFHNGQSANIGDSNTLSWTQTCSGMERALVLGLAWDAQYPVTSADVLFDGTPMEPGAIETGLSGNTQARQMFRQRNPTSGNHTITVALNGALSTAPPAEAAITGTTRLVHSGGDFQAAINASTGGDAIVLDAGATFTGNFTLPAHSGGVITIKSSATLPSRRVTAADASLMPTIASGNASAALTITSTSHWRLDGLQVSVTTTPSTDNVIAIQGSADITMDRLLISGGASGQHRGIQGNGTDIVLCRSHIDNIWLDGYDSQAFAAWDGAGPYTILDNYLEAASENVMFGGAASASSADAPADILVEGNYCFKPRSWIGTGKNVKNLFELKSASRATIRRNVFLNNWTDGQAGTAIVMTPLHDSGSWSVVQDVVFEQNIVAGTEGIFELAGYDGNGVGKSGQLTRVTIRNNLGIGTGYGFQLNGEIGLLTINHNTIDQGSHFINFFGGFIWPDTVYRQATYAVANLICTNNLAHHNSYGVRGDTEGPFAGGSGTTVLTQYCPSYTFRNNVLAGDSIPYTYPATTQLPTSATYAANFNPDYSLKSSSSYLAAGTDYLNLGVTAWAGLVRWLIGGSLSLSAVNQTTIARAEYLAANNAGPAPTVTVVNSQAGDLVVDAVIGASGSGLIVGSQSARLTTTDIQASGYSFGMSTVVASGASQVLNWTGSTDWATGADAFEAAADPPLVLTPPAGSLVFKGPQQATSVDRWVQAPGVLAWVGLAASILLSVATPSGALTLQGLAPTPDVGPSFISTPGAGSLVWHGLTPTPLIAFPGITLGAGSLVWGGFIPDPVIVTKTIVVPAGSLVFKGPARPQEVPQPGVGSVVFAGQTPQATVAGGGTSPQINVGVGVLVWHGEVPTDFPNRSILVGAGSLVLSGQYFGVAFSPLQAGSLVWQGLIPTVIATSQGSISPGAGSLVWQGLIPTVFKDQGPQMPAGSLVFHGLAPTSGQTTSVLPGAGSLVLAGQVPLSLRDLSPSPGAGHVSFGAQQVLVVLTTVYDPGTGSLVLTGYVAQPTVTAHEDQVASPDAGVLTFTGQTPTVAATTTTDFFPGAGSVVLGGLALTLGIDNVPQMGCGSLVFSGQEPERSQISEIPNGVLVFAGQRIRSVNSGDTGTQPPLAYGTGLFYYQTQRRQN